jgi:hypothetical protein
MELEQKKMDFHVELIELKQQIEENENNLSLEYKDKIEELKLDVLQAKNTFDKKLEDLKSIRQSRRSTVRILRS